MTQNRLEEVSEVPIPKGLASNNYRKSRLLAKGCPKLIRLVEKHQVDLEKSLESQKYSQRMISYRDRIKMSIMTTRAKTNNTPTLGSPMDEATRGALSGLNQNRNVYNLKKQLIRAQKHGLGGHSLPSMTPQDRPMQNTSDLQASTKKGGHVPKLLLTQALQFQKQKPGRNGAVSNTI